MGFYFAQLLTGLANASSLFLVASGLSIIFGVTRIVNFTHGSFYMLGAFLSYSLVTTFPHDLFGFWGGVFCSALIVAIIGALMEMTLLRRIYHAPELFQLVATFGVVLIIQDVALALWGAEDLFGPRAPGLEGAVRIFNEPIPEYDLLLIAIGPVVLLVVWLIFYRTRWGVLVRAATEDREMVGALGVNQNWLFTSVFMLGSFLAGLGGALQVPRESVSLLMDLNIIAEAFVIVVIGGMGSIFGAFVAAILIGVLNAFGVLIFSSITLVLPFLVMAIVLVVRPWGLFGKPERPQHSVLESETPLKLLPPKALYVLIGLILALGVAPSMVGEFTLVLGVEILIAVLFAASLHFLMGLSGMHSFGHAVYFGLGSYGAALAVTVLGFGMLTSLIIGPLIAMTGALLFGWFCVRLSGVYLAMLTLAAAQIIWSIAFQWYDLTGGDDGILGVWPAPWAASKTVFYYIALVLCVAGIWVIHRMAHAPFGYVLRGGRDCALRVEAIGIDLRRHRWIGFALSGALAGLAGAIFVFSKGSVFPDELAIPRSIDGLIMVLLGGVHSLFGPLLGAGSFVVLEDLVTRFDYWRFIFGLVILIIVVLAPDGIVGGLHRLGRVLTRYTRSGTAS